MMFSAHKIWIRGLLALFCLSSCLTVRSQTLSSSKLSAHFINDYTVGNSNIVAGRPRVLKVLGLDGGFPSGMAQAMRDYKTKAPTGKVVVRIYSPRSYSLSDDATGSASDFWTNILQKGINYLSPSDRALIDYLEGPNEGQTPTLGYPNATGAQALQASQWFNQFWTNLTPKIVAAGYKPCIGSIAVGNPGGSPSEMQSYLAAFVPALRQAMAAGGSWSYHAYTINYTTDPGDEFYYSLRYRQFYSYFASSFPDLNTMPLILTEGGVDASGDPSTSGWQARGPATWFQRWLNWFDQQMQQDPYVLGCTLFENGDPGGWSSFELEPLGGWMKNYLLAPTAPPPAPTSIVAVPGSGSVNLYWTNAPLNPTTWNVKRATNLAGPYWIMASGINTGIASNGWTDSAIANFVTNYYVVTAVNAFGESTNSNPVVVYLNPPVPNSLNCGGSAIGSFVADSYFDTGTPTSTGTAVATNGVSSPAPMSVYQSQRYGNFTYTLPYLLPNRSYKVRLHFAEIYWTAAGQRIFNVLLNGAPVLNNFDIYATAGGNFKANIQEFNAVTTAAGTLAVQLVTVVDNAALNAIELIANPTNSAPAAPTNLTATVGNALVSLSWAAPAGATQFSVKRSTVSGSGYSLIASNLTSAWYRDTSFVPNTTYYYVVSATNVLGESPNSSQVSAKPTNGLPDVVLTSISMTPVSSFTGSHIVFSARVLNRGSAATPSGITLGIGFNVDGAGTASWSSGYSTSLPANTAITLTADGGPTGNYWTATPGPHSVVATVDDINRFPESIEDNNSLSTNFSVSVTGYAVNSGGGAVGSFVADNYYGGSANTLAVTNIITTNGVPNPAPTAVYQTERWGESAYLFNNLVPGSNYTVRLHFAEISPSVNGVGDRRFNISVNGVQALTDFDVLAFADTKFRGVNREIKKQADASGNILVQFTRGSANEPKINGVEVLGSSVGNVPLQFTGLTATNHVVNLTWQTATSAIYQVQYKTNLLGTNWTSLGNPILSSASSLSISDPASGPQKYYRVLRLN